VRQEKGKAKEDAPFGSSLLGWAQWCVPVIPDTPEAKIGKIMVQGQPGQKLARPPILLNNSLSAYNGPFHPIYVTDMIKI
jgi:hypothetical protein